MTDTPPKTSDERDVPSTGELPPPTPRDLDEVAGSKMPTWIWRLLLAVVLVFFAAWIVLTFFRRVHDLVVWLVTALFISFALEPAVNWLAKRGWRRGVATFAIMAGVGLLGILMLALMAPVFVKQVAALITATPGFLQNISVYTQRWFKLDVSSRGILDALRTANIGVSNFAQNIAGNILGVGAKILGAIFQLLTIALFTFYLVADGPRMRRALCSILPPERQHQVLWTWEVAVDKTGGYLYSRLLLAIASGTATFIVLEILRVPFALPLAVWMGLVSQFIPTIGTYIAMALPLLVAITQSTADAVILLGFFTLYQQAENYLLAPRITAKTMQMHPAVAFGAAIAGASVGGAVGAILAIPAAAIIQATASTYIKRHDVMESDLTKEADPDETKRERELERQRKKGLIPKAVEKVRERSHHEA